MSLYYGNTKIGNLGLMNLGSYMVSSFATQTEFDELKTEINEKIDNLSQTVEGYKAEIDDTITKTFQEYTQIMNSNNPGALLPLDSTKYYNNLVCFNDPNSLSAKTPITLCEVELQQEQNVRLTIEYSSIANDTTRVARMEIYIMDVPSNNYVLFDTLYTDSTANSHHSYQRWFNCTANEKILVKIYPSKDGSTAINANLKVDRVDIFQVSDTDILSWTSHIVPVDYQHIASNIFTYNETFSGRMIVVGKTKYWKEQDDSGNDIFTYNSDEAGRTPKSSVYVYNATTKKNVTAIPFRVIPTLEYCISGYDYSGSYAYKMLNPANGAATTWKKLSADAYYVFGDSLSCEISDIHPMGSTEDGIRITNSGLNEIFTQLSATHFMKNNTLYNTAMNESGKKNTYWMALVKIKEENGKYMYDIIEEKNQTKKMSTYQFSEVDVEPGDRFCILMNAYSNQNLDSSWDFKTCPN